MLGLLALLLLTDARRAARTDGSGALVLLEEQDRARWDQAMIADGEGLLVEALRMGQPGPYQLWARSPRVTRPPPAPPPPTGGRSRSCTASC